MTGEWMDRRVPRSPDDATGDAAERAARRWRARFIEHFGRAPTHAAQAPGRVNLIGEHVDYTGGWVLPMAIDRRTVIAAAPAAGPRSRLRSTAFDTTVEASISSPVAGRTHTFADRALGVVAGYQRRGAVLPELDLLIDSGIPIGGGLSSSAALEVAMATLVEAVLGATATIAPPREKALLCQRAEHEFAGVPAGIMDMFASIAGVAGHAILLDCRSLEIEAIPVPRDASVLVVDTLVKHDLADGAYAQRRRECEEAATRLGVPSLRDADEAMVRSATGRGLLPPPLDLRALHVASENRRTLEFVAALRAGDLDRLGRLLFEGHASLRDRFEVSCAELDRIVESAASLRAEGAIGARMTGGGFGGCAIVLCRRGTTERVGHEIAAGFRAAFGREPARFAAQAAGGAGVLDAPRSG